MRTMLVEIAASKCPPASGDSPVAALTSTSPTPETTGACLPVPSCLHSPTRPVESPRRPHPRPRVASAHTMVKLAVAFRPQRLSPGHGLCLGCTPEIGTRSRSHGGRHAQVRLPTDLWRREMLRAGCAEGVLGESQVG